MEVIVTDHHQPAEELPDCLILHPEIERLPVHRALRDGGRLEAGCALRRRRAGSPAHSRGAPGTAPDAAQPTWTWWRWRRSPTWCRWSARTGRW